MTGANDDVIMSHQTIDIDSASNDAESLPNVISQLATTSDPMPYQSLKKIATLFTNVSDTDGSTTESSCELTLDEIYNAHEQKNTIDDCVTFNGTYRNFINPFTFRAATKGNNPDSLSCGQMMKTEDQPDFFQNRSLRAHRTR